MLQLQVSTEVLNLIPLCEPYQAKMANQYIQDCLNSNWISSLGSYIGKFENHFKETFNHKYCVAVSNGTSALHVALNTLGIGENDEVIVPDLTFAATINAVIHAKARPVIARIDKDHWNISLEGILEAITDRTKAVIIVHLYGVPIDVKKLREQLPLRIKIIEDSAEALGAKVGDEYIGTYGDASTYSFFGNKVITTGEGGMVVFNSQDHEDHARSFIAHGRRLGTDQYEHIMVGHNYRMTNIQAAIGLAQIQELETILLERKRVIERYKSNLNDLPLLFQSMPDNHLAADWLFTFRFDSPTLQKKTIEFLRKNHIQTKPVFPPLGLTPIYKKYSSSLKNSEQALQISLTGLSLPTYPGLNNAQIDHICSLIKEGL